MKEKKENGPGKMGYKGFERFASYIFAKEQKTLKILNEP